MRPYLGLFALLCLGAIIINQVSCVATVDVVDPPARAGVIRVIAPPAGCWSGSIGNSTKDGCGSRVFRVDGTYGISANAQKTSEGRWSLRLELVVDGVVVDRSTTTAPFGIAQVVTA